MPGKCASAHLLETRAKSFESTMAVIRSSGRFPARTRHRHALWNLRATARLHRMIFEQLSVQCMSDDADMVWFQSKWPCKGSSFTHYSFVKHLWAHSGALINASHVDTKAGLTVLLLLLPSQYSKPQFYKSLKLWIYIEQLNSSFMNTLNQILFLVAYEKGHALRETLAQCAIYYFFKLSYKILYFFWWYHWTYNTTAKWHCSVLSCVIGVLWQNWIVIFHDHGLLKHLLMNGLRLWYDIVEYEIHKFLNDFIFIHIVIYSGLLCRF